MEMYSVVNGKRYRKGYTTGSCAAAASKAAVKMLFSGQPVDHMDIDTPAGIRLKLPVSDVEIGSNYVKCSVIKDGGDDPDITTGLKIFAEVRSIDEAGIKVSAGEGIGVVTLPGLKVKVGEPAINPVPMKMILKEAAEVLPPGEGVEIVLSVPGGEAAAERTYNPRLGIIGGISILGTSGIVQPMSEEAWKDSLALELGVMAARGMKKAVFVFGNYGEDFAIGKLGLKKEEIIKISNFVGFMLDRAAEMNFESIYIVGHIGKLVKLAAGIFHTHSRVADARMEVLAAFAALEGADRQIVEEIYKCRTTDAAAEIIDKYSLNGIYDKIVSSVSKRCREYTFGRIEFGTVLFNGIDTMLAADEKAKNVIKE